MYENEKCEINELNEIVPTYLTTNVDIMDATKWKDEIENDNALSCLFDNEIILKDECYVKEVDSQYFIVVPKSMRKSVFDNLHNNYGHPGIRKTTARIRDRYFWPNMTKDIKELCKQCHMCAINKNNNPPNSAPLLPMETSNLEPFQRVAMDILGPLPEAKDGSKYVLVLQDYFTKWPEVIALKTVDAKAVQNWLTNEIVPRYGVPTELITDQGVQFVSNNFKDFCNSLGVKQKFTSPFHPQTDGMVERFNRTFLNMIRNYVNENQTDWSSHIPLILFAYRSAVHETIGVSPAEALQIRKLKLPIDMFRSPSLKFDNVDECNFDTLCEKMKVIRAKVRESSDNALAARKTAYDNSKNRKIKQSFNKSMAVQLVKRYPVLLLISTWRISRLSS